VAVEAQFVTGAVYNGGAVVGAWLVWRQATRLLVAAREKAAYRMRGDMSFHVFVAHETRCAIRHGVVVLSSRHAQQKCEAGSRVRAL